jgi:endonuclease/exonuclease/phosphatase family metal-dependent hydrolase
METTFRPIFCFFLKEKEKETKNEAMRIICAHLSLSLSSRIKDSDSVSKN